MSRGMVDVIGNFEHRYGFGAAVLLIIYVAGFYNVYDIVCDGLKEQHFLLRNFIAGVISGVFVVGTRAILAPIARELVGIDEFGKRV